MAKTLSNKEKFVALREQIREEWDELENEINEVEEQILDLENKISELRLKRDALDEILDS